MMLRRRFLRLAAARSDTEVEAVHRHEDDSFESLPDLVIIDGGKGQLSAAREVMEDLGVHQITTFGLAKRKEELYPAGSSRSIMLPLDSPAMFLLQRVRDEAHRFAVTFHRKTRDRDRLGRLEGRLARARAGNPQRPRRDPLRDGAEGLHDRIRDAYFAARRAVDDEPARLQAASFLAACAATSSE